MFKDDEEDVIVSDNEGDKGNPFHKPAGSSDGGEFTSGPESGNGEQSESEKDPDLALLEELGISAEDLQGIADELEDLNQPMQIPLLNSVEEIENNIEKFFSKKVIATLESMVGATSDTQPYLFHPKANPNVSISIYTCVFGKYRYPDNNAKFIDRSEYNRLKQDPGYEKIFRGITAKDSYQLKNIVDSYGSFDFDHLEIYGNGVFGTNVYTTVNKDYAQSYASNYRGAGKIIYGLLSMDSHVISSDVLKRMKRNLNTTNIVARTKKHLLQNGLSEERADLISSQFGVAMTRDISLLGILLGYDYQISDGHQRNILNLSKWYILKED